MFFLFCVLCFIVWSMISTFELFNEIINFFKSLVTYGTKSLEHKHNCAVIKRAKEKSKIIDENYNSREQVILNRRIDPKVEEKAISLMKLYPYSDSKLIDKYRQEYSILSFHEIENLENEIRRSHFNNYNANNFNFENLKIKDIDNATVIEVINEYPLKMTFYKLGINYIFEVINTVTSEKIVFQSKSHMSLLALCNEIYEKLHSIKSPSMNMEFELNTMFDETKYINILRVPD